MNPVGRKVKGGAIGASSSAAAVTVVIFLLAQIPAIAAWPEPVRGALAVLFLGAASWAGSFVTGYLTEHSPPSKGQEP